MLLYSTKVSTSIFCKDTKSNEDNYIIHINFEIILLLFQKFAIFAANNNKTCKYGRLVVFLGFIFVCGIIWGIVKGQEDRERAQERGLTFDERIVPVLMQLHGEMVG